MTSPISTSAQILGTAPARGLGVAPRILSTLIDFLVLGGVLAFLFHQYGQSGSCPANSSTHLSYNVGSKVTSVCGAPVSLFSLGAFLYYVLMEALLGGTVGKLLLNQRVVRLDGSPVGLLGALIRTVLRIVDGFLFYLVAVIVVAATASNQRVGDLVAKTHVVRRSDVHT